MIAEIEIAQLLNDENMLPDGKDILRRLALQRDMLKNLLSIAKCPNCDGSGAYYDNNGEVCQCHWCYEVKNLK